MSGNSYLHRRAARHVGRSDMSAHDDGALCEERATQRQSIWLVWSLWFLLFTEPTDQID